MVRHLFRADDLADDNVLHLLEFVDRRGLEREAQRLRMRMKSAIVPGYSPAISSIESELNAYFNGALNAFKTRRCFEVSAFQKSVWQALIEIPYGQIRTYSDIAKFIGAPSAFRAVANTNGANQLAIIVPAIRPFALGAIWRGMEVEWLARSG